MIGAVFFPGERFLLRLSLAKQLNKEPKRLFTTIHPRRVSNLVIVNAPHLASFSARSFLRHPRQLWRSKYVFFFQMPTLPEIWLSVRDYYVPKKLFRNAMTNEYFLKKIHYDDSKLKKEVARMVAALAVPGALEGGVNYYRALKYFDRSEWNYPKIRCPVLVLWVTLTLR
jgi:pimeloyl-ACP methyl ester carboxylesterase